MLNTFPALLSYGPLAPFILRVVLGLILVDLGFLKFGKERSDWSTSFKTLRIPEVILPLYALLQIVAGVFLIVGFYTQPAALAVALFSFIEFYIEYTEGDILKRDLSFYLLILVIALSLLFTGAGRYAFDIPL